MTDPLGAAKGAIAVVGEVMKLAGDSPELRGASTELGKAALTITKTVNNALLPLAAVNFAFDKARVYFAKKFESDLAEKMKDVPAEQLAEPKASIAGPALQGLAFSHEEVDLKELYLSLLASSMDSRTAIDVHPAFVEIIRQISAEEARLLRELLRVDGSVPIVEVRATGSDGWETLRRHLLNVSDQNKNPVENPRIPAYVDNWVRLGLATVEYDKHLTGRNSYDWAEARPEVTRLRRERETAETKVTIQKGILSRTSLGIQFGTVVGVLAPSAQSI